MSIIINQVSCPIEYSEEEIIKKALNKLFKQDNKRQLYHAYNCHIYKTSLDARDRNNIHFVHSVICSMGDDELERNYVNKNKDLSYYAESVFEPEISGEPKDGRIVIAGFGPAGMFCGLALAEKGYKPVILERGNEVDKRVSAVKKFWSCGELDVNSNVQFGEGGAGTFSDGKLTTRIKDPLCRYILNRFVEFGAPEEIMHKAKPHIGTDNLRNIVKAIRERIISLGGEVRFDTRLEDFTASGGNVKTVITNNGEEEVSALVLALGHSARDTFEMLADKGVFLEPKAFSVGARIEHLQKDVDESLYGEFAGNKYLPKGEYQLSYHDKTGRGVYTFCMCPGGFVVPAASENGGIVTNGMSEFLRDGDNANAAVVVSVRPDDFGKNPLDGVNFARRIEQNAYVQTGCYKAPAVNVGAFLEGRTGLEISDVRPTYESGVQAADFNKIFPEFVCDALREGIYDFGRKMKCFKNKSAVLTAPETRTSSPVRITRNKDRTSLNYDNLYPCGEGAGYAGGIMSAAVDGLNTAAVIMKKIAPKS